MHIEFLGEEETYHCSVEWTGHVWQVMTNNRAIPDYASSFLFAGKNCQNCLFTEIQTYDTEKGQLVMCPSPSPSSASFTLRFLLPLPFFLSKRDFGGAAVFFGSSASSLLDSAERFRGCCYLLKIWPMKYNLLLACVSGSRHRGNPERHQFIIENRPS